MTLGIPKWVGEDRPVGNDAAPVGGHAAGVLHVAPDGDVLLLRRSSSEPNYAGHFALPGGKAEPGEDPSDAADRECQEEIGFAPGGPKKLIDRRTTPNGMLFHTYARPVEKKFAPALNDEHSGYAWAPLDMLPGPLHPSVKRTLDETLGTGAQDMTPEDWAGLREGFAKWTREEEAEGAHDAALAYDRALQMAGREIVRPGLAFDRESVRELDRDGRMRVAVTNISKATVNPYVGREIPGWRQMSLDPDRIYRLYRDPDELAKGAPTFNGLPLLSEHVAVTADSHDPELVLGATGTDAVFDAPYLKNSLVLWTRAGIDGVESEEAKEVSSSYHYRPDMTPGVSPWGEPYDGVMRDIVGNHVALVREGRAGADVVVGDSNEEIAKMAAAKPVILTRKAAVAVGALMVYLQPKLAKDSKLDLGPLLAGVTAKNFKDKKAEIATGLKTIVKPMLAKDASVDDVVKLLDTLDAHEPLERGTADAMETDPNSGLPMPGGTMGKGPGGEDENSDLRGFLASKGMGEDDISTACGMGKKAATDEFPPKKDDEETDEEKKKKADAAAKDEADKDEKDKKAMDAAIKLAVDSASKAQRAARDAEKIVRPYVGELATAFDSADEVYGAALKMLGVKIDGVPAAAFPAILAAQPLPHARKEPKVALDSASAKGTYERFNDLARIRIAG